MPLIDLIGVQLIRIQSAHLPGYNQAIASSIRDGPVRNMAPAFAAVGRRSRQQGGEVLLIWVCFSVNYSQRSSIVTSSWQGTKDQTVPYHCAARIKTLIPHADLLTIEGAGHEILQSHTDEISDALLRFLSS